MQCTTRYPRGFTLIELIVVIGIIATLAAIVILAVNPSRQFAQSRNVRRQSDIKAILDAVQQYAAATNGFYPTSLTAICPTTMDATSLTELAPDYLSALPVDPRTNNSYKICKDADGRITVSAPDTDIPPGTAVLSMTR